MKKEKRGGGHIVQLLPLPLLAAAGATAVPVAPTARSRCASRSNRPAALLFWLPF